MLKELLNEALNAKPQAEYERNYSAIPVDIYERIAEMDPKTTIIDGNVNQVGFMAKQLLLPKYIDGDTAFVDENKDEEIKQALSNYKPGKYPNLASFGSIDQFLLFMEDPEENVEEISDKNQKQPRENKIDAIYNQYYSEIPRDQFDMIISADPNTSEDKIGDFAKNLFLTKYLAGDKSFVTKSRIAELKAIMQKFESEKNLYTKEDQDPYHYKSIQEFVEYVKKGPESDFIRRLKADMRVDARTHNRVWDDIEFIGSDANYNVFIPKSQMANFAIGGGYTKPGGMHWCTNMQTDNQGRQDFTFWDRYRADGEKQYVMFMRKGYERGEENKIYNWQGNIDRGTQEFQYFLDGRDKNHIGTAAQAFKTLLLQNPTLVPILQDHPLFNRNQQIADVKRILEKSNELIIDGVVDIAENLGNDLEIRSIIKKVVISNVEEIPVGMFCEYVSLKEIKFDDKLKVINQEAFKNCGLIHLELPDSLEFIGAEAFANCTKLKGSIRIPDSVNRIGQKAFMGDDNVTLKVNKNRENTLHVNAGDKTWYSSHMKAIDVRGR